MDFWINLFHEMEGNSVLELACGTGRLSQILLLKSFPSILIVVVVAIDTVTQVQTRLMSSQYEQLIKKTKFGR